MLQQFYKDTLQSNFIKYLLANTYIPTVPFTSNILHITKGNIYIHDGFFVTAKESGKLDLIREQLEKAKSKGELQYTQEYEKKFIKHEPYIFGRRYNGVTTNYVSNVNGYDSTTHYYLGEYLRAYRSYYNIDLMPYYNCFSNEYINYLSLDKPSYSPIKLNTFANPNYKLISVPIKFCQKYSIAIQCNSEILMMPAFIGKKGLLKEKTKDLNSLNRWGKAYPRSQFNSPILYESPHIDSVQDLKQSALQSYDKYLRLLIQIPSNLNSSIVILEGDYKNSKTYSQRIINTSKEDVKELWSEFNINRIPYRNSFQISKNSSLTCLNKRLQKLYLNYDNVPIQYNKEINNDKGWEDLISFNLNNEKEGLPLLELILNNQAYLAIKANMIKTPSYPTFTDSTKKDSSTSKKVANIDLSWLLIDENLLGSNCVGILPSFDDQGNEVFNKYYRYEINNNVKDNLVSIVGGDIREIDGKEVPLLKDGIHLEIDNGGESTFIAWNNIFNNPGNEHSLPLIWTVDKEGKCIRALVVEKKKDSISKEEEVVFYNYELAFYIEDIVIDGNLIKFNSADICEKYSINGLSLNIPLKELADGYFIRSNPLYSEDPTYCYDNWEIYSQIPKKENEFSKYLNNYMYSNLNLLYFNNSNSYAFTGRLVEYLIQNVISSNDINSKNIKRVQDSLNTSMMDGFWSDDLRVKVFDTIKNKSISLNKSVPRDINGFVDKDSEFLLGISNKLSQDEVWK